jgi:nitroreductase
MKVRFSPKTSSSDMPDALDLLKTRRTVAHTFLAEPGPSPDELNDLLTIGVRVPDHGKLTPWRLVVFNEGRGQAAGDALESLLRTREPELEDQKVTDQADRFRTPPVVVLVISRVGPHPKIPEWEQFLSSGAVAMNIVLAAHALGYSAQWLTGIPAEDREAAALLGAGEGERIVAVIPIGTPSIPPVDRPRPAIADVVTWWKPEPGGI